MEFCHLHVHSHYSILEGMGTPLQYVQRAKALGQKSIALTDHGNMYGLIEFYKAAKSEDIQPILGVEFYMALEKRTDRRPKIDSKAHNLILLAQNKKGYENLITLTTKAHLEGFYFRPRVDFELLTEYSEGLICLTSDYRGIVSHYLLSGLMEEAKASIKRLQKIFGQENVFAELEDHPQIEEQKEANRLMKQFAHDLKIPLIATNDVHYISKNDHMAQDVLLCIKDNRLLSDQHRFRYTDDFSLKSTEEMKQAFVDVPEALSNTIEIANRCKVHFQFGKNLIPDFKTPKGKTAAQYLRDLVMEGVEERYGFDPNQPTEEKQKNILQRVNFELETITTMGFDEYFLIIWDLIHFARNKGIVVGPGRGSAAGAIITYCLKITDLDPLQYELLFERFLNPARVSMPDIDIDFEDERRDEILSYVREKYGKDRVAQVITFGTMAAKAAVKDVGRVFGVPFAEMNRLTKLIPSRPGTKLQEALKEEAELKEEYAKNKPFQEIVDIALRLEGTVRQAGVHACAVIISKDALTRHCPLQKAPGDDDSIITQYSMKPLEDLGLLKMDFLGLRNLTILRKANTIIEARHGKPVDLDLLPMDDTKTFQLLSEAKTTGVFQLESSGMKRYLRDLKPSVFEDIIAMGALYRPGPMQFIPDYIAGKHGERTVKYVHEDLKLILEKTYGIAVYQEQILQIAQKFAGFSLGEADLLRRAIGKKIASELMAQREKFIEGSVRQGYRKELATDIFDTVIEPFANYGFNRSHAACYAMISYQTAYLKAHFPAEFMAALMTCDQENLDRVVIDIHECELMDIKILPPDINESREAFSVTDDHTIRYGLSAIKNLGADSIRSILEAREEGPFTTLTDLLIRIPPKSINKKSLEALIMSGAFDRFADRNALMQSVEKILESLKELQKGKENHQSDLFALMETPSEHHEIDLKKVSASTLFQKLQYEKTALGMYVSDHPLRGLRKYIKRKGMLIGELSASMSERLIRIGGLKTGLRKMTTKQGATMLVLELEDLSGKIPVVIFPKVYEQIKDSDIFEKDDYFITVEGKLDQRGGELQIIARSLKKSSIQSMRENAIEQGLFDVHEPRFSNAAPETEPEDTSLSVFQPSSSELTIRLKDEVHVPELKLIKGILEKYPGQKPVTLNLLMEGKRQNIVTGLLVDESSTFLKELEPYVESR